MVYDWFNRTGPEGDPSSDGDGTSDPAPEISPETPPSEPAPATSSGDAGAAGVGAGIDADALEWAKQAYARLKAQQEAAKQAQAPAPVEAEVPPQPEAQPVAEPPSAPEPLPAPPAARVVEPVPELIAEPVSAPEPAPAPAPVAEVPVAEVPVAEATTPAAGLSLLELAAAQRAERQQALASAAPPVAEPEAAPATQPASSPAEAESEPQLGAFDDTFTWSAEVLAAQGKRADQVSLEEIDWLGRLRQGLEKTRQGFVTQLLENLGDDPLTPEVLDDLEGTLLRADVGVQATDQVLEALRKRLNVEVVDPSEGIRFLKEQLRGILNQPIEASGEPLLAPQRDRLNVWLMVGVNGVGKTTTLGKLANLAVRSGYSCLIAAADTFRAAAVQQVQVWGERSGVPVIANPSANADPAAVVFDAIGAAKSKGTELVLVDTAGRLQTKHNLMEELAKVRRIVDKLAPDAVVESLLVLDASQGQNGLRQAMAFAKAAGLTGVVLTKLDGSARGGVALAVASEAGLPIRFVGAGEGLRDLRPFNSFEFVEALLSA